MNWKIEYISNSFSRWFKKLGKDQASEIAQKLILLEKYGNNLGLPYSRSLTKGLFELRDYKFGLRVYYTFWKKQIVIILASGDKSSHQKDINKARERLKDIKG